jgi:hypothetical protein
MRTIGDVDKQALRDFFSRHRRIGWEHGTDFLMVSPLGFAGVVDGKHLPLDECHKAMKRNPEPHKHGPECRHEHP